MVEEGLSHQFGGGVLVLETNHPVAVAGFELRVGRIIGVHAHGVIELIEPVAECGFDDFEVTDHLVFIEFRRFHDDFHLPGVSVRELALVRMLGQHVAVFDFDGFADAVGH